MSPVQLADDFEQFRLSLDMFRDELEPGRIRQIRETTKVGARLPQGSTASGLHSRL